MTKSCFRAVPDDRLGVQNDPTCTNIGFSVSALPESACLGKTEYGEKGQQNFHAVTWQSISRDAEQAVAHSNHQCQWEDQFHDIEQENKGVAQAESKNPYLNYERGTTFCVIGEAQTLCFAGLCTSRSDGLTHDQVKASESKLLLFSSSCCIHEIRWPNHIPNIKKINSVFQNFPKLPCDLSKPVCLFEVHVQMSIVALPFTWPSGWHQRPHKSAEDFADEIKLEKIS